MSHPTTLKYLKIGRLRPPSARPSEHATHMCEGMEWGEEGRGGAKGGGGKEDGRKNGRENGGENGGE